MQSKKPEYAQGEIVWADYPLSDKPAKSKIRPVLVISNASSNSLDNDLLILPITSRIRSQLFKIVLTEGMTSIALPALSAVRCNKLHKFRNTRILGEIASVTPVALRAIVETVGQAIKTTG